MWISAAHKVSSETSESSTSTVTSPTDSAGQYSSSDEQREQDGNRNTWLVFADQDWSRPVCMGNECGLSEMILTLFFTTFQRTWPRISILLVYSLPIPIVFQRHGDQMMDDVRMSFVQIAMGFWKASQPLAYLVKSAHVYAVRQSSPPGDLCSLCCGVQCVYRLLPPNYNFCHAEGTSYLCDSQRMSTFKCCLLLDEGGEEWVSRLDSVFRGICMRRRRSVDFYSTFSMGVRIQSIIVPAVWILLPFLAWPEGIYRSLLLDLRTNSR